MVQILHNPNFLDDCLTGSISDRASCYVVAEIDTEDLSTAYVVTQNDGPAIWGKDPLIKALVPVNKRRSTSWGDVMILKDVSYFVDGIGFNEII